MLPAVKMAMVGYVRSVHDLMTEGFGGFEPRTHEGSIQTTGRGVWANEEVENANPIGQGNPASQAELKRDIPRLWGTKEKKSERAYNYPGDPGMSLIKMYMYMSHINKRLESTSIRERLSKGRGSSLSAGISRQAETEICI